MSIVSDIYDAVLDTSHNLVTGSDGSSKASGTSFGNVRDNQYSSYWAPSGNSGERISVKFTTTHYNTAVIYELGNEVSAWRLVNHITGETVASGESIGARLRVNFKTQSGNKLNLMLDSANYPPLIAEFEVYMSSGEAEFDYGQGDSASLTVLPATDSEAVAVVGTTAANTPHPHCVSGAVLEDGIFDCGGITLGAAESCLGDAEGQEPVLTLKNATVKNLVIDGAAGGDGIHCTAGDCILENVVWEDICEDAATLKYEGKSLTVIGGSAYNDETGPGGGADKVFQHNSKNSYISVTGGFTLLGEHGKLWRSCGNCRDNGGPRDLHLDNVIIDGVIHSVAGANGNYGDRVSISNLAIKHFELVAPKVCEEYIGVDKKAGVESQKLGVQWNTSTCDVDPSDITSF